MVQLPKEVLTTIFHHLHDRKFTRSCGLVCKDWRIASNMFLYTINGQEVQFLSEQDLLNFLSLMTSVGKYFKSIHLSLSWEDTSQCAYLMDLLANRLPNLEKISEEHGKVNHYIWILTDKITHSTRWPKLKYISRPIDPSCIEFYNACALKYANSLTHLSILDQTYTQVSETIYKQEYLRISKQIHDFPYLENLELLKQSDYKSVQTIEHMLTNDNLKEVTLKLYGEGKEKGRRLNLTTIKKLPGVKKLCLCCVPANDDSLLFIMHKFCGLKDIHFDSRGQLYKREGSFRYQSLGETCIHYSAPVVASFLKYILDIPRHLLFQFYISKPMEVLILLPETFFNLLEIRFVNIDVQEIGADMSIDLRSIDKNKKEDLLLERNLPSVIRVLDDDETKLHAKILDDLFICKHFRMLHINNIPPPTQEKAKGHYLDKLFLYSSQLKVLKLSNHAIIQCNPDHYKSASITHFLLHKMVIANEIFPELSARLALLKYLKLWECTYADYNGEIKETKQVTIDMPYTSRLTLVIGYFFGYVERHRRQDILFKVCTLTGEKFFNIITDGSNGAEYLELDNILYKSLLSNTTNVNYVIYLKSILSIEFHTNNNVSCTITF